VNSIGEKHIPQLFVRNHRAAIVIETKPHAPLADAKPVFGRCDVLKPAHVTDGIRCVTVDA